MWWRRVIENCQEKIKICLVQRENLNDINNISKYNDCGLGLAGEWSCSNGHKQGLFSTMSWALWPPIVSCLAHFLVNKHELEVKYKILFNAYNSVCNTCKNQRRYNNI